MFPNLTGLWVRSCLPRPIPLRAGLASALPSLLPPLPLFWCTRLCSTCMLVQSFPTFTVAYLHCCVCATPTVCPDFGIQVWKRDPSSEAFRESTFASVCTVDSFRSTCILFTESPNKSKFLSQRSLFRNSSSIYILLFVENSHRLTLLITAETTAK